MPITFPVDEVERASKPAPTISLSELVGAAVGSSHELEARVLETGRVHPLLAAVDRAFAEHRPLVLSPDAVWLTLAQGIAQHTRLTSDELRGRLVRHEGRRPIEVGWGGGLPASPSDWRRLIAEFRASVTYSVGAGLGRFFLCDFSTSTNADRIASELVLCEAFSPFFELEVYGYCGIPEITLLGEPSDWERIRARVEVARELGLGFWTSSLAPIADQLVWASQGRPDIEFFRGIYKPKRAYLNDRATGWIARLFPYVRDGATFERRNPLLEVAHDDVTASDERGLRLRDVPRGLASVDLDVRGPAWESPVDVRIEGGLLGVEEGPQGLAVRTGFLVRPPAPAMRAVLDRLSAVHHVARREAPHDERATRTLERLPVDLQLLYEELDEATLVLDGAAWRVRPLAKIAPMAIAAAPSELELYPIVDLPDASILALAKTARGGAVVRLPAEAPTPARVDDLRIVARSFTEVLRAALASNGALEPERGRLSELVDAIVVEA